MDGLQTGTAPPFGELGEAIPVENSTSCGLKQTKIFGSWCWSATTNPCGTPQHNFFCD